jgi:hypothetical protein
MHPIGTEGELRPSGSYGRNRRDFCCSSEAGRTRSVDPERTQIELAGCEIAPYHLTHPRQFDILRSGFGIECNSIN